MAAFPIKLSDDGTEVVDVSSDWLSEKLGTTVTSVSIEPYLNAGGLTSSMKKVSLTGEGDQPLKTLVLKTILKGEKLGVSKGMGLAREALFYNHFGSELSDDFSLPNVLHAWGDVQTGAKVLLMEDLSFTTQSGYFFGPGSPLNAGKDLDKIVAEAGGPTAEEIARLAFISGARLHAKHWNQTQDLVSIPWLMRADWFRGEGREGFEAYQSRAADYWKQIREKIKSDQTGVKWDANLVDIMDASMSKISWERFQEERVAPGSFPVTLVHGDFHPANMMFSNTGGKQQLYVLDWEVVGIGSGPQDIGQYMISHASPDFRRSCEEKLLREYHSELTSQGVELTWEACKAEYVLGGAEKWFWMLAYLAGSFPDGMAQYFQDQVAAFVNDHNLTPAMVSQPRM
ncbi:hypothetical protein BSKO_06491 [Bryopsis sp. KO-2023]|nr:hypothetical protein BSKO_06491 [Bryopsis sp. KO-2023]